MSDVISPHDPKVKIPQKNSVTLGEVLVPGKPILLTMPSENAALQTAKEEAWKKNLDPVEVDCEFLPPDAIEAMVQGVPPGGFVILSETRRAPPENIEKVKGIIRSVKDRILVVVQPFDAPNPVDPNVFTESGGHSIKLAGS